MDKKHITVEIFGNKLTLVPKLELYTVRDFTGKELPGLAVCLETEDGEEYNVLTVSFGEFIGVKNCAYIDANNNDAETIKAFIDAGYMKDIGYTKHSGFCVYPLYLFNEDFLKAIGEDNYTTYSNAYDACFAEYEEEC